MAHNLEMNEDGTATSMVYVGEVPWHGLGKRIPADLHPSQALATANLDWEVDSLPLYFDEGNAIDGHKFHRAGKRTALVRLSDGRFFDVISKDWKPVQNSEAFDFFAEFCEAGDMQIHTAGALDDGRIVWCLAKISDGFTLLGGRDQVDSYMLFTNPHKYGQSVDIRLTPIRVVCNNTLTLALNGQGFVKVNHRSDFDAETIKEMMGVSRESLDLYRQKAELLVSKSFTEETVKEFFTKVFPLNSASNDDSKKVSRNAAAALMALDTQAGASLGSGTWWSAFNATTYLLDHKIGISPDTRMKSAWYGQGAGTKTKALKLAVDYAMAA